MASTWWKSEPSQSQDTAHASKSTRPRNLVGVWDLELHCEETPKGHDCP